MSAAAIVGWCLIAPIVAFYAAAVSTGLYLSVLRARRNRLVRRTKRVVSESLDFVGAALANGRDLGEVEAGLDRFAGRAHRLMGRAEAADARYRAACERWGVGP